MLPGKHIVLGVTGSIAVHRAVDLASKLTQEGALVDVVLTDAAQKFITPLTFRSLTHRPVVTDMFDPESELSVEHVRLAQRANVVVVAPASAHLIARLALGLADDMLTTTVLATRAPLVLAPAMNVNMWENTATRQHVAQLKERGSTFVGPVHGRLATGLVALGRLAEVEEILGTIKLVLGWEGDLSGRRLVVSAGGTQEPIDAVRVITNRSSGKMGYALAAAALERGARVTLVSAPTALPVPVGADVVRVRTAAEMREAVLAAAGQADALLMAAAVADYRPAEAIASKLKKEAAEALTLSLVRTVDILAEVPRTLLKVGFAAEPGDTLLERAREKVQRKGLDLIVANDITAADSGFEVDTNRVVLIDREGQTEALPLMSKRDVAHKILDRVVALLTSPRPPFKQEAITVVLNGNAWRGGYLHIVREHVSFFPGYGIEFELEAGGTSFKTTVSPFPSKKAPKYGEIRKSGKYLRQWFAEHPELKTGSQLLIEAVQPPKRYRLSVANLSLAITTGPVSPPNRARKRLSKLSSKS